jgi:hypothetical protein
MDAQVHVHKSWLGRHWMWCIPGVGCLAMIAVGIVVAIGIVILSMTVLKNSDVYKGAVMRAQQSEALREEIGSPVRPGLFVLGSINITILSGHANVRFTVSGPRGKAKMSAVATRSGGPWEYSVLMAEVQGSGRSINLLAAESLAGGDELDG